MSSRTPASASESICRFKLRTSMSFTSIAWTKGRSSPSLASRPTKPGAGASLPCATPTDLSGRSTRINPAVSGRRDSVLGP